MTRDERYHQITYDAGGWRDPELPLWPQDGPTKQEREDYAEYNARLAVEDLIDEVGRTKASFLMSTWLEGGK